MILFRRRLHSVADVFTGVGKSGLSTARWQALMLWWAVVCRQWPTGPVTTLEPWKDGLPQDLHGFFQWVFDLWKS